MHRYPRLSTKQLLALPAVKASYEWRYRARHDLAIRSIVVVREKSGGTTWVRAVRRGSTVGKIVTEEIELAKGSGGIDVIGVWTRPVKKRDHRHRVRFTSEKRLGSMPGVCCWDEVCRCGAHRRVFAGPHRDDVSRTIWVVPGSALHRTIDRLRTLMAREGRS